MCAYRMSILKMIEHLLNDYQLAILNQVPGSGNMMR